MPQCGAHSSVHNPSVAIPQKRQDGPGRECGVESLLASRWEGLDLFLRSQIWMEWEKEMIREKTSLSDWRTLGGQSASGLHGTSSGLLVTWFLT